MSRVLVVEDHPRMRETIVEAIDRLPDFEVIAAVGCGEEALDEVDADDVDLVVVDLSLPTMSGAELVARIGESEGDAPACLVLSGHRERSYVESARAAGARGYVVKGNPGELVEALGDISLGRTHFGPTRR